MYNVVLVDDDIMVTEFLRVAIPWSEYGFQVVGEFQNGVDALNYVTDHPVDLLITDIGMPMMNGIELLEQIHSRNIRTLNVILSCHEDFHYAQKAMKLRTLDYILKESMQEETIIQLIKRMKEKLDNEKNNQQQQDKVEQFLRDNNMALKTQFVEELLKNQIEISNGWWTLQEELLGMNFTSDKYTVVLCFIDQYSRAVNLYESKRLLDFSIHNIISEIMKPLKLEVEEFYLKGQFFLLFSTQGLTTRETEDLIEQTITKLHRKVRQYLKITITSLIGRENQHRTELVQSMQLLNNHVAQRFYYAFDTRQTFERMEYTSVPIFQSYNEILDKLRVFIVKKSSVEAEKYLLEQLAIIKERCHHPSVVKDWATKLVLDLKLFIYTLGDYHLPSEIENTDELINPVETIRELEETLVSILQKMIVYMSVIEELPKNKEIFKAQKFVLEHIGEKISLTEIANHLHMNASYFSRVFKKETGESFIEFVTRIKMEKAKEMLNHSTKPVEEIAHELGFDSKSYFFRTFKKQFGVTPNEYKFSDIV